MSAHGTSRAARIDAAIDAVKGRSLPGTAKAVAFAGIAYGVVGIGYGFVTDPAYLWGAWLVTAFYFLCMAQGAIVFAGVLHGTKAYWGRPLKRIAESIGMFLPVPWIMLAIFLVAGVDHVYSWSPDYTQGTPTALAPHSDEALPAKEFWLSKAGFFFQGRQLLYVALMMALDFVFLRNSLGPDLAMAARRLGGPAAGWWGTFSGREDAAAGVAANDTLIPIMAASYAVLWSLLGFDLIMSVDPWWFSNMFGGWLFMSSLWMGMATVGFTAAVSRKWLGLDAFVSRNVTHDLGKLLLAGTMFWAYTLFAQILPIYYTNVPEETNFLLVRLMLPQWRWMSQLVAILCFLAPFTILLSRGLKKMRGPFIGLTSLILTGLFFERSLLVLPSVWLGDTFPTGLFLVTSVGLFAGMAGIAVLYIGGILAKVPAVPVADPYLDEHPWEGHVHAYHPDGAAHASK